MNGIEQHVSDNQVAKEQSASLQIKLKETTSLLIQPKAGKSNFYLKTYMNISFDLDGLSGDSTAGRANR